MDLKLALKVSDKDNVATIFADGIVDGTEVEIRDKRGDSEKVKVIGDVPFGHKIAVRDIHKGELIMKYGEEIGIATQEINTRRVTCADCGRRSTPGPMARHFKASGHQRKE